MQAVASWGTPRGAALTSLRRVYPCPREGDGTGTGWRVPVGRTPVGRRSGRGAREGILKAAELLIAQGVNATGMDQPATVANV